MKEVTIDNLLEKATRSELIQLIKMFINGLENARRTKNYYDNLCEKYETFLTDDEISKVYHELDEDIEKNHENLLCKIDHDEYSNHSLKLAFCLSCFFGCEMIEDLAKYTGVPVSIYQKIIYNEDN